MTRGTVYNEVDPGACNVLRELIANNLIAPGDVDERSIKDVRADDYRGYTQVHCFAGAGMWSGALRAAGWPDARPIGSGSCPCQGFSLAGKGLGFDDPRSLRRHGAYLMPSPKEQLAQWMIKQGFATGHGDTMADMLGELEWQIEDRVTAARTDGYADGLGAHDVG